MKKIRLEDITFNLFSEGNDVRVATNIPEKKDVLFVNQSTEKLAELILENFRVVHSFYLERMKASEEKFVLNDISTISAIVVLHYLYMYNSWKTMYKKQENKSLTFDAKDFKNPSTYDIIFDYCKSKYPNDWQEKSAILLNLGIDELRNSYAKRNRFYHK